MGIWLDRGVSWRSVLAVMLSALLSLWCVPLAYASDAGESASDDAKALTSSAENTVGEGYSSTDDVEGDFSNEVVSPEGLGEELFEATGDERLSDASELADGVNVADAGIGAQAIIGGSNIWQVDLRQRDRTTTVEVALPNLTQLASTGKADEVAVEAVMAYKGVVTRNVASRYSIDQLQQVGGYFEMDFADYGKFSVVAKFYKKGALVTTGDVQTIGIVADEYNIAPVSATLPLTFFSLSLWGDNSIRYSESGEVIPTVVLLERPASWNWDSLPEGVYGLPYLNKSDIAYQPSDFSAASELFRQRASAMATYVSDLYEMNPTATFNLYCVDFYVGLVQAILYANGIPQDQYTITVMSDGSYSYAQFASSYSGANPSAAHDGYVSQWSAAKQQAYDTGRVSSGFWLWEPNRMLYAAADSEPNAQWWLARPALLESPDDGNAFGTRAQADNQVVRVYIDRMLNSLQVSGDQAVREFKALYNFSDAYFADAEEAGKDVMLFLGSTVGNEAGTFPAYARFAMAFYGDKYVYYYKGHPGSPTDFYPSKQQERAELGITDVDSSVAAELILFFYPDIFLSGYGSSTYASITNPDMAKGLFRSAKKTALADVANDYSVMDWYMSPVGDATDPAIKALCSHGQCYLVEFSDQFLSGVDYTIAIWDDLGKTISFYKAEGDSYRLIRVEQGSDTVKVCTISAKVDTGKVVDISAGSLDNGANAQIWESNESLAQRYRVVSNGDNTVTFVNVGSGKVLDVAGAGTYDGVNVCQYEANGANAQKWQVIDTGGGDGSCYLVSKCNGLYLDVQWAGSDNGTNLNCYTENKTNAQKFYINYIEQLVVDGSYVISSCLSDSGVLDISDGSKADGGNVQLYSANGTPAQTFDVRWDSLTGYYAIGNVGSGKLLDVAGAGSASGTNVWQYAANGTKAQM